MIHFLIPLRSEQSSNNWEKVVSNFNRTLDSCFNQTCEEFKVVVICNHPAPKFILKYLSVNRLKCMEVTPPLQKLELSEMMVDKAKKIFMGMEHMVLR